MCARQRQPGDGGGHKFRSYLDAHKRPYIHPLDGALSDNVGRGSALDLMEWDDVEEHAKLTNIPTNLGLTGTQLDHLLSAAAKLLRDDKEFQRLLRDIEAKATMESQRPFECIYEYCGPGRTGQKVLQHPLPIRAGIDVYRFGCGV